MTHDLSGIFETELTSVREPEPRIYGPWRKPAQMLEHQSGGNTIHDDAVAAKVGFQAGPIEGPTHFSQLVPLGHALFGEEWHVRGCISSHFRNPCVEGDAVRAWVEPIEAGARVARAGAEKRDGTPVLAATLSLGPDHPETELDALLEKIRPAEQLVILQDMKVGMKGAEIERVRMEFDQNMGALYPFSLEEKLARITEPCRYYGAEGAAQSPWGRPIIPFEMISVLANYTVRQAKFPIRRAVGLFVNQEIRLIEGPLFVGEEYLLEREVVALSESRRVETNWVRTTIREAKSERQVASMLLNSAVLKASYPNYEEERAALA